MIRHQVRDIIVYDLPVAAFVFVIVFAIMWLAGRPAHGADFVVVNKTAPKFVVENKTASLETGDLPSRPTPEGFEWVRYSGSPWELRKKGAVGVAPGTFRYTITGGCANGNCPIPR